MGKHRQAWASMGKQRMDISCEISNEGPGSPDCPCHSSAVIAVNVAEAMRPFAASNCSSHPASKKKRRVSDKAQRKRARTLKTCMICEEGLYAETKHSK